MITHKEAIEKLKLLLQATPSVPLTLLRDELIELLESEMWHDYPKEKPKESKSYLVAYPTGLVEQNNFVIANSFDNGNFLAFDKVIIAWREIPKYESEEE